MSESFMVTALPYSAAPGEDFHVSLFVSFRLAPDGHLGDFARVSKWTAQLPAAKIALYGGSKQDGSDRHQIAATPRLDELRSDLWPKVFPSSLEVRAWKPASFTKEQWQSFSAHRFDEHAAHLHDVAMLVPSLELPGVAETQILGYVEQMLAGTQLAANDLTVDALLDPMSPIGEAISKQLDGLIGFQPAMPFSNPGPGGEEMAMKIITGASGGIAQQLGDAHEAQLYYQPPKPEDLPDEPPATPDPDFHDRCTHLAGMPTLQRWLGLVVDLEVQNPGHLGTLGWIQGDIAVEGLANAFAGPKQPRTRCYVRGHGFFAVPTSEDWNDGALRLGAEDLFTVLDLDPDASALGMERYLRTLPGLLAAEANGDPVSAAPPALRASGFSVARNERKDDLHQRLGTTEARTAAREAGKGEPLWLEEVTRGLRLEVWDDGSDSWHTLHARTVEVEVAGQTVEKAVPDVGYLQGAALSTVPGDPVPRLHEVIAAWSGWSLSAPPPGKTILEDGKIDEVDPGAAVTPLVLRSQAKEGSLPRLRYGRSYAFRALAVDLAGNSRPHPVGAAAAPSGPLGQVMISIADRILAQTPKAEPAAFDRALLEVLRERHPLPKPGEPRRRQARIEPEGLAITDEPDLNRLILRRTSERATRRTALGVPRQMRIERALIEAFHASQRLHVATALELEPDGAASLIWGLGALVFFEEASEEAEELEQLVADYINVVTKPRPFLRWDPVLPPTVVPRHPYSAGESLLTLVVRSGVEVADGSVTVTEPGAYAAAHPGQGWRATSERHLAPPKTSELEAELHGRFDFAIGSSDPAKHRQALGIALRESGTLLDTTVADLDNPGKRLPQPGVELHHAPSAEPPEPGALETLERGEALPRGQYVVHDVDQLVLPYLPDPLARGLSLVFPDAGRDHRLDFPWSVEGLTLRYRGAWPEREPYRLVLESGEELAGRVDGNVIRIALPPGEQLCLRLSSALRRERLELLGLWRNRDEALRGKEELVEAAADGWYWWLTPSDEVRLVHAVPRPVEVPRIPWLKSWRVGGSTEARIQGLIDIHGPSTGRLDLEARWTEPIDDLTTAGPRDVDQRATPWGSEVRYEEDFIVLVEGVKTVTLASGDVARADLALHQFGDTKHRVVEYRGRATTRYREHFEAEIVPTIEDISVVSEWKQVSIPSSARPPKPVVRDVLPLFRWREGTEPDQPFGLRRVRRSGLRIYLERPWYATGEGELLGVLMGPVHGGKAPVSEWAGDPVWNQAGPADREAVPLTDALHGWDEPDEPGRPVTELTRLPLDGTTAAPEVGVLGYRPEYNAGRGLWFVDLVLDQGGAVWPFVHLVVARYQPDSLHGLHLSAPVACDFAQLTPDRVATLTRPDRRQARVVVTGPLGSSRAAMVQTSIGKLPVPGADHTVRARLERQDKELGTDLAWKPVSEIELEMRGFADENVATWVGTVELPQAIPPRRPGSSATWRVAIEEWERLPADPAPPGPGPVLPVAETEPTQTRLVFADHLPL